ncbi:MAG: SPOR domain-containing protein [Rhodospirillales bacterium]|nr:SPOR domain-containing protein [Rhodospirillales bacterium]
MRRRLAVLLVLATASCQFGGAPHPHNVLGAAWQAEGMWHYPRRMLSGSRTGIVSVRESGPSGGLTADGEAYDPEALAAASPDLQLPAIARVTNLAAGRSLTVRVNDRGPRDPGRLLALTPRAARLLGVGTAGAAVRMTVLTGPTQAAEDALAGGIRLAMRAAPVGAVTSAPLGPSGGGTVALAAPVSGPVASGPDGSIRPALSGRVAVAAPSRVSLFVRLGRFDQYQYAAVLAARMAGLGARVNTEFVGREQRFAVRLGPFADIAAADRALRAALAAGVSAPRIVVR